VYRARHGIGAGFRQIGGVGLVLPAVLRGKPEYPELAGREEAFIRELPLDGKVIYDVGAFEGIFTMYFAKAVGPRGRVVAFEPHPANQARVHEHLELNEIDNVTVVHAGVGDRVGELRLASSADTGRATADEALQRRLEASGAQVGVVTAPLTTIDGEIAARDLPAPDLVKIDVEGFEQQVLEGMRSTIEAHRPDILVEIHGADLDAKRANARGVTERLLDAGYEVRHVESSRAIDRTNTDVAVRGHLYATSSRTAG
jgi:FkbM family methyltransferase